MYDDNSGQEYCSNNEDDFGEGENEECVLRTDDDIAGSSGSRTSRRMSREMADRLIELVLEKKDIIILNNANRSQLGNRRREDAWKAIRDALHREFPSFGALSVEQLNRKWQTEQQKTKSKLSKAKKARAATAGGAYDGPHFKPGEAMIVDQLGDSPAMTGFNGVSTPLHSQFMKKPIPSTSVAAPRPPVPLVDVPPLFGKRVDAPMAHSSSGASPFCPTPPPPKRAKRTVEQEDDEPTAGQVRRVQMELFQAELELARKKAALIDAKTRCYGAWARIAENWNEGKFDFPLPITCWTATAPSNGRTGYDGEEMDEEVVVHDENYDVHQNSS